jgi:hypothetical protein
MPYGLMTPAVREFGRWECEQDKLDLSGRSRAANLNDNKSVRCLSCASLPPRRYRATSLISFADQHAAVGISITNKSQIG